MAPRARLPKGRYPGHDQARVEATQVLPAEVPAFQYPRAKILDDHIALRHQLPDDLLSTWVVQVQGHDLFIAVFYCPPVGTVLL